MEKIILYLLLILPILPIIRYDDFFLISSLISFSLIIQYLIDLTDNESKVGKVLYLLKSNGFDFIFRFSFLMVYLVTHKNNTFLLLLFFYLLNEVSIIGIRFISRIKEKVFDKGFFKTQKETQLFIEKLSVDTKSVFSFHTEFLGLPLIVYFFYYSNHYGNIFLIVYSLWLLFIFINICNYILKTTNYLQNEGSKTFIRQQVKQYSPQLILYGSGMKGSSYQMNQWLCFFEQLPFKTLIMLRESDYLKGLNNTNLPILYSRKVEDTDLGIVKSVKAIFYPANGQKNAQLLRYFNLSHVFINHGESDKAVNISKFLKAYDLLFLAGPMAYDRFSNVGIKINNDAIKYVGRPQLEDKLNIVKSDGSPIGKILYAPTWEGFNDSVNYCSISENLFEGILGLVEDNFEVIFKPHPYTGNRIKDLKNILSKFKALSDKSSNFKFYEDIDIHELMNESDLLISDVSSVLNDYLFTEKPIILTNINQTDSFSSIEFPSSKACYILKKDMSLLSLVQKIEENDIMIQKRVDVKHYSLGVHEISMKDSFISAINELL